MKNKFKKNTFNINVMYKNTKNNLAMKHSMMLYNKNALYSFIPKNACSTLRLSVALENGCIDSIKNGNWIHSNNQTFNATIGEVVKASYSFVVIRCPFRRLTSVFLDKFVSKEIEAWQYRDLFDRKIELDDLSFREFVLSLNKPAIFRSNIHWRPQVDFLIYDEYSDYFSFENFKLAVTALKEKIGFDVIDARELTKHGTDRLKALNDKNYADTQAFDIAILKRNGMCPSHASLYDKELFNIVSELYSEDIALYKDKCSSTDLLKITDICNPVLDIHTIKLEDVKNSFDIDFLRDEAIRLEKSDLPLSYKLMSIAKQARPAGVLINKKLAFYEEQLLKRTSV